MVQVLNRYNSSHRSKGYLIDIDIVRNSASIGCTVAEIATILGVHKETFEAYARDIPDVKLALEEGRESGRATLRRMQWQQAELGNTTMLIWLGKQMLGQRDKQPDEEPAGGRVRYVVEMPAPVASEDEWMKRYAPPEIEGSVDGQP